MAEDSKAINTIKMKGTRGGRRPGAGRKPKSAFLRSIDGGAGHRGTVPNPIPLAEIDHFDAPDDLTTAERNVWLELAPHAFKKRTLNKATSLAFRLLCRNVVLERAYADSLTDKGGSNHRGMIQRVDAELLAFDLRPCGKPIYEAEDQPQAPANPLTRFLKTS